MILFARAAHGDGAKGNNPEAAAAVVAAEILDLPLARPGYLFEGINRVSSAAGWQGGEWIIWVDIQTSAHSSSGELHLWQRATNEHVVMELPGRVGFAFPASVPGVVLLGLEKEIVLYSVDERKVLRSLCPPIDRHPETLINDALLIPTGILFGTKHTRFTDPVAKLYFLGHGAAEAVPILDALTISNGMDLYRDNGTTRLIHVDTPRRKIHSFRFDERTSKLSDRQVLIDLAAAPGLPDGLCLDPSKQHLLVALFNNEPHATHGEVRQYSLASGELEKIFRTEGAPQATCPALLSGKVLITTAREAMSDERIAQCPNSGRVFVGDTDFGEPAEPLLWPV